MNKREREICQFEIDFQKSVSLALWSKWWWHYFLEARSENECEKWYFWSEIGLGFGEPGGTPTRNYQEYPQGVRETELRIKDRTQDPGVGPSYKSDKDVRQKITINL